MDDKRAYDEMLDARQNAANDAAWEFRAALEDEAHATQATLTEAERQQAEYRAMRVEVEEQLAASYPAMVRHAKYLTEKMFDGDATQKELTFMRVMNRRLDKLRETLTARYQREQEEKKEVA